VAGTVTDPYFPQFGWHLENTGSNAYQQSPIVADADVDATEGWDVGTGDGMLVAVVDTGFDSDHPDMVGSLWTNPAESCGTVDQDGNGKAGDCHGWNFYADDADVDNGTYGGHGASVSGVVGARAGNGVGLAGVAPGATIMPLVIGGGQNVDVFLGAQAIRYAVDHGADVINASWGGAFTGSALDALRSAVAYAAAHDVLIVAAAGNDSLNRDTSLFWPASLTDWNVITVGSSTAADTVSTFSAVGAASVDLFAPGTLIATTSNTGTYIASSGTSLASPMVAAAVALYRAAMPSATAAEIKQALLAGVDPLPAFIGKSVTGGRLTMSRLTGLATESVSYAFTSMTAPAGAVSPAIGVTGPSTAGDYDVVLGLGMEAAGEIWALSGKAVTLDGVTVTTDDAGDAVFPLGSLPGLDGTGLAPTMELGDGRYVLTVQAYRDGNPVGRTYAAPLLVGSAVPAPGTPGTSTPGSPGPDAPVPGTTTYPSVGLFRITSLSPDVVDTAGGTVVTITGLALPADPTVRIGRTTTATIVQATTTRLTFRVPARVAGVYDVTVFAPDGRSTVLSNALTYADAVGSLDPGDDGTGGAPDDGTTTPGGTAPGTSPGGTTPGGSTPEDGSSGGSTPATGPIVRSGPAGERLVRSAKFDGLRAIWSLNCSSSCTGVAI
jgi:hypothetical protein